MRYEPKLELMTREEAMSLVLSSKQWKLDLYKLRTYINLINKDEWDPEKHREKPLTIVKGRLGDGNHRAVAVAIAGPAYMYVLRRKQEQCSPA